MNSFREGSEFDPPRNYHFVFIFLFSCHSMVHVNRRRGSFALFGDGGHFLGGKSRVGSAYLDARQANEGGGRQGERYCIIYIP